MFSKPVKLADFLSRSATARIWLEATIFIICLNVKNDNVVHNIIQCDEYAACSAAVSNVRSGTRTRKVIFMRDSRIGKS